MGADGQCPVTHQRTDLRAVADVIAQQGFRPFGITPLHTAGIHVHGNGRAGFDGVDAQFITETIKVGHVFPVIDGAAGPKQRERLEFKRGKSHSCRTRHG